MKRAKIPAAVKAGEWPRVDPAAVPGDRWPRFASRRLAIHLYIAGSSQKEITLRTSIGAGELQRIVERFLTVDAHGNIFGEHALIPGFRVKNYERVAPVGPKRTDQQGGMSGVLGRLLVNYPEIEAYMLQILTDKAQTFSASQDYIRYLVRKFYEALERLPLTSDVWPYNTKHEGRRSIERYIHTLINEHMGVFVRAHGDAVAVAHLRTGRGHHRLIRAKRPGDIVELDGYFIDSTFIIQVETTPGYFQEMKVDRIWLLAMIDSFSKAIFAYKLVLRSEVSAVDVREVIARAVLGEWKPLLLTRPTFCYLAGAGLPSGVIEGWPGTTFCCLAVDSHLSNVAEKIVGDARQDFGFMHCLGPSGHFESRPNIERLFREVARQVQLVPSTTGSAPNKGRPPDAEEKALHYHINVAAFEEALDVALANYCTMPTEGNGYLSPLAVLTQCLQGGAVMPAIPPLERNRLLADLTTKEVTVRGSVNSGRWPHVQLDRVRYTNDILCSNAKWIGNKLLIEIDSDDYRAVKAYLPSGESIGHLRAMGWWAEFKHSVRTRKKVNALVSAGELRILRDRSPVQQISDYFLAHGLALEAFDFAKSMDPSAKTVSLQTAPGPRESDYYLLPSPVDDDLPHAGTAENKEQT